MGRLKGEKTVTPGLRVNKEQWTSVQKLYPRKINKMFNEWVQNECHSFDKQGKEDVKQGLYFAIKALDQGNQADISLANRLEIILNEL